MNPSLFLLTTWILLLSAEHSKVCIDLHVYLMDGWEINLQKRMDGWIETKKKNLGRQFRPCESPPLLYTHATHGKLCSCLLTVLVYFLLDFE